MSIDPTAIGATAAPRDVTWTSLETILYALGVGAGRDELPFVTENSHNIPQQVLPTFGVIACDANRVVAKAGKLNWGKVVHGAQEVRLRRPLPPSGSLRVEARIVDIQDKGEGGNAIIVTGAYGFAVDSEEPVVETISTLVVRGAGGFRGQPGVPAPRPEEPVGPADQTTYHLTSVDQALIYRLSGDRNPLHSDPWFATTKAGFERPILHGLCTYGYAGRALLNGPCEGDVERFRRMKARFASPVFPGEVLRTDIWVRGEGAAAFRTMAGPTEAGAERVVLADGSFDYRVG